MRPPQIKSIVEIIVDLAHKVGLRTVAEGVEDEAALQALAELGCDAAQAYHLARPMPAEDISVRIAGPALTRAGAARYGTRKQHRQAG